MERLLAEKDKYDRCCPCLADASEAAKKCLNRALGMENGVAGLMLSTDLCGGGGYESE